VLQCADMAEKHTDDEVITRVYEAGYHVVPNIPEADVEKIVAEIRAEIERAGGSFIAEGAPSLVKLAYGIDKRENERHIEYDRGYFGWIKFEAATVSAKTLTDFLNQHASILRSMVFKTLREDTRAKFKAPQLRDVKRSDVIKAAPRRAEGGGEAVSEVDLEKALETLTKE